MTKAAGKPAAGKPAAGKPAAGKPAAGKPAAGPPAAGKPAAGKPAAGPPAAGKPAAGKRKPAKPELTPRQISAKILELYRGEKSRWTVRSLARDLSGAGVSTNSRKATCWCLYGAALKVSSRKASSMDPLNPVTVWANSIEKLLNISVIVWNDEPNRTFQRVEEILEQHVNKGI